MGGHGDQIHLPGPRIIQNSGGDRPLGDLQPDVGTWLAQLATYLFQVLIITVLAIAVRHVVRPVKIDKVRSSW